MKNPNPSSGFYMQIWMQCIELVLPRTAAGVRNLTKSMKKSVTFPVWSDSLGQHKCKKVMLDISNAAPSSCCLLFVLIEYACWHRFSIHPITLLSMTLIRLRSTNALNNVVVFLTQRNRQPLHVHRTLPKAINILLVESNPIP